MAVVHARRRRSGLGAIRGDIDPVSGKVFDGAVWQTPNDGESQTLSDAYKSYMLDPFVNMTEEQKALYAAGQGATDLAYFSPGVTAGQYDATAAAANAAATQQALTTRAAEIAALTHTVQTAQAMDLAGRNSATAAANTATQLADVQRELASIIAAGGVFANTIRPGGYTAGFLQGMLTTDQWIADRISLLNGGAATNSNALAGRIPPLPAGVYVIGSNTDPGRYTSPSTGASTGYTTPTRGTNPDGSQVVWNPKTETWDPATRGTEFADVNAGSAGANYSPSGGGAMMPGGSASDVGGGAFALPGGLSPMLLLAGGAAALLLLRRKR